MTATKYAVTGHNAAGQAYAFVSDSWLTATRKRFAMKKSKWTGVCMTTIRSNK